MRRDRKSTRLERFDYSSAGAYFVTICTQDRAMLFEADDVVRMIEEWWGRLESKFKNVTADEFVAMPNHVHGIVFIDDVKPGTTHGSSPTQSETDVGADPRVRPDDVAPPKTGPTHGSAPTHGVSLGRIVQWFKTMTTNEYIRRVRSDGWAPFPGRLWQRNYYDHIVRNEDDLNRARRYIRNNPARWNLDRYFTTDKG